jgi:hypothetical protein
MKTATFYLVLVAAVAGACLSCPAQTNPAAPPLRLFCLPEARLRVEDAEPPDRILPDQSRPRTLSPDLLIASPLPDGRVPDSISLNRYRDNRGEQLYRRIKDQFDSIRKAPGRDNGFAGSVDSIFRPEVFRVRKAYVSCSVLTAIKRKNPLCLLNPIFLNVSW